jgi:hypothetical protein
MTSIDHTQLLIVYGGLT